MRLRQPSQLALKLSLLVLTVPSSFVFASTYDCNHIRTDGQSFDLSPLTGAHSVSHIVSHPPSAINTTFTLDICKPLRRTKGVPKENECPNLTRVCGIQHTVTDDDSVPPLGVIPIAGDFVHHGRALNAEWTRLKTSSSHADSEKEGLRVVMHGGKYPFKEEDGRNQKAVIEFLCDESRTGLEGLERNGEDKKEEGSGSEEKKIVGKRAEKDEKDEKDGKNHDDQPADDDRSLKFIRYGPTSEDSEEDTLRLEWRTKYACEGSKDGGAGSKRAHWGFFTWFIIM